MPFPGWLDATVAGIFGLLIGSFLNVVIYRLPRMMERQWAVDCAELSGQPLPHAETFNLMLPRSRCQKCGHPISWLENVPVLSYLALRGKCLVCKTPISPRYPLIELLTAAFFLLAAGHFGLSLPGLAWAIFSAILIVQFFIDFDTQLLPDDLNYLLLWIGLIASALGWTIPLKSAVFGAVAGYLSLWSVYHLYRLATGKEGMGYGDFKLLAALGVWFGFEYLLALILLSSLVGSVIGAGLLVAGRLANKDIPIAFGPFLAGAGLLSFAVGPGRLEQYVPFAFPFLTPDPLAMFRLGLTGGVGSGKSTVATMLAGLGAGLVDADAISRQLTAHGGSAIEPLRQTFGTDFITADSGLDRQKIRQLVFADPQARKKLESIVHPLVQTETRRRTQALEDAGCACIVFDVPLLVESSHWRKNVDKVLVIDCSSEVQVRRTALRDGLEPAMVEQIISAQASRDQRLKAADWVLCNDRLTLAELTLEVVQVSKYCGL